MAPERQNPDGGSLNMWTRYDSCSAARCFFCVLSLPCSPVLADAGPELRTSEELASQTECRTPIGFFFTHFD
eukprot:CAMPEP_0175852830 /NCGR_PEP_ID=MMETSP0107_2-20121207/26430_1 /TAXON_ID=195067 ORGANISM="Goniomonas pacifica, Strain CCMP1869" /NCGR_SAMPLE_ID=MMETSP0107_2 /ASSEMBLY_ACC=CAM_ASM_000203 /LENGTH=71 /DNA_ID=CAMNT_0017168407 /DNA_START=12 /DNA_END=224 /DNA_ORIENTATION=-